LNRAAVGCSLTSRLFPPSCAADIPIEVAQVPPTGIKAPRVTAMKSKRRITSVLCLSVAVLICGRLLGLAATKRDGPLSKEDITLLLLGGSTSSDIIQTAKQRGIDFEMDPALASKLHDLGASDALVETLRKAGAVPERGVVGPTISAEQRLQGTAVAASGRGSRTERGASEVGITLPAGTRVRVELGTAISTQYSRPGDAVQATVIEPVAHGGQVVVPIGTGLSGHVEYVQPKERRKNLRASVRLLFSTFSLPNHRILRCRAIVSGLGFLFRVAPDGDVSLSSGDFELKPGKKFWVRLTDDLVPSGGKSGDEEGALVKVGASIGASVASGPGRKTQNAKLKETYSARISELRISATSAEEGPVDATRPGPPHRMLIVHVRIQNISKRFPCTSLTASLRVEPFYEYPALLSQEQPSTDELLPGEAVEGQYSFDIRDGVVPDELVLTARESQETRCTEHPDWGSIWHYRPEARIPMAGLSVQDESANEPDSPANNPETAVTDESVRQVTTRAEQEPAFTQEPGTAIVMDDHFEYRVVDYGVGGVQIRPALSDPDALSQPVFWIEFRVTNVSEHLLGAPRFSPSEAGALAVVDNWGNSYQAWCPSVRSIWGQATLPVPERKVGRYKPQESSLDLVVIPVNEFVKDIDEVRVYLDRYPGYAKWHFFSIRNPLTRRKNLLKDELRPPSAQLAVSTGSEDQPPPR
jgi:hypothetical protein